jgi:uncharacterized protein YkwD
MKFPYGKITTISATALLAVTLSTAIIPAANASTLTAQSMLSITSAVPADSYNAQVLALINIERAKVGARPLVWNQSISNVSQDWAAHLGVATLDPNFNFATIHRTDAGGNEIPAGATWYREIIAFASTPETIVNWWMGSPAHKAAMLDPKATDIGIGYVAPSSGPYAGWHQVVANLAAYPTSIVSPITPGNSIAAGTQFKTTIQLNLRSGPGTTYGILGYGATGTIVTATGKTSDIWYEVTMGSQTGWMSSDYLTKYASSAIIPPSVQSQSAIAIKAASLNGGLGTATSGEIYGLKDGGGYQNYQRGAIIYSPTTGAHISMGAIRNLWAATGYENGGLGYPTSDEIPDGRGGVYQTYQHGAIVYAPGIGTFVSLGAIRNLWLATGSVNGGLGYPTSNEIPDGRGGVYQTYQHGAIVYAPGTGTFVSLGAIRNLWLATGSVNGGLGYPTSNEIPDGRGGSSQNFQHGAIVYAPGYGTFISLGGIRGMWLSVGAVTGRLGYPTSNEYSAGAGIIVQNFQGGKITWSSRGGVISYN